MAGFARASAGPHVRLPIEPRTTSAPRETGLLIAGGRVGNERPIRTMAAGDCVVLSCTCTQEMKKVEAYV